MDNASASALTTSSISSAVSFGPASGASFCIVSFPVCDGIGGVSWKRGAAPNIPERPHPQQAIGARHVRRGASQPDFAGAATLHAKRPDHASGKAWIRAFLA